MLSYEQARNKVIEEVGKRKRPCATAVVSVWNALGLTLAQEVKTDREYPPFDRSTRDGYAVRSKEATPGAQLRCAGEIKAGDSVTADTKFWDPKTWPADCKGFGPEEAPRGALGHWIHIKDQKIGNYQIVVPSTWNASPKDSQGQRGAYEAALMGTPMADPKRPVEILRTIHSFDPCLACATHVTSPEGETLAEVLVR